MTIDMRLISIKDGGRFAMSWVAGTNPKALHSNLQRARIYTVDVPEVCEEMMEAIKSKEHRISFRILIKLCFGTIRIFAEQAQHLYSMFFQIKCISIELEPHYMYVKRFVGVTMNFVCFNTFMLKHYSRKRLGSTITKNGNKRRRVESSDGLDITSLLLESEIFNDYSEEKFKFPNNMGINGEKKQNTSTCIQIKQITIRQISWDNPLPEEEEAFGEATQDDRMMLLSGLSGTGEIEDVISVRNSNNRKRRSSFEITDCSPLKKSNGVLNESIDEIRCAPSICNDTMSEFSVDLRNRPSSKMTKDILDYNGNRITQDDLISTQGDLLSQYPPVEDQMSRTVVNDVNNITIPESISENIVSGIISSATQNCVVSREVESEKPFRPLRKRHRSHLIIDKVTKISKTDMNSSIENIWLNCHNYEKKEHIARIDKIGQEVLNAKIPSRRFQSAHLLVRFKNNFKSRMKHDQNIYRRLIFEEILGDEFEAYKTEFNLKSRERCKADIKKPCEPHEAEPIIKEYENLPDNCDVTLVANVNNDCFQPNGYCERNESEKEVLQLRCSLNKIDPYAMSFDFPTEAGKQRSEWGKEGVLLKLLLAWISENPNINMNTIIVGASRINAALAFHTLLDLAGLQYIEIIKDKTNSIESILMGPEMIRKINEKFA